MKNKTRPRECVTEAAAWSVHQVFHDEFGTYMDHTYRVIQERETRARLKKEKEEVRPIMAPSLQWSDTEHLQREAKEREVLI